MTEPDRDRSPWGCLPLLATCAVICLTFVVNGIVFNTIYASLRPQLSEWLQNGKTAQVLMFVVPTLMLVIEWMLVDWLGEWLSQLGRRTGP